ncbi:Hypothetical protein CAP_1792 [Chondromyces apiculatus DSM 436]|uniref:Uncharacterized protein n=1 Tax=Chondromyces apiculatus DSM 436 TaxID=1192034 RepID=A0A017TCM2_9BACT|nr:Hypothetical protein CAP_1792 [Chondromyces apiculatus DSM 436]
MKQRQVKQRRGTLDGTMRATLISVALTAVVLSLGALASYGQRPALGVALGGTMAVINLYVFAKVGEAFLGKRGNAAPWAVIAVVKLCALVGAVWLILRTGVVPPLALAVGFTSLVIGITVGSLFGPKPPEDEDPTPGMKG